MYLHHLSVPRETFLLTHGSIEMLVSSSSHKLRRVAAIGFAAIISIGLASCTGAGFGPPELQQEGTPDLIVGSPSASDSGPVAGVTFTLRATVRNLGDGASAATTLRYYRSTDATITASDTEVGTDAVAALAPAGDGSESVDLTAPTTAGTYYYGACVDPVTDESDTTNNCASSVRVTVREPEPGEPDLVVAAPTVSDSGPAAGASFTLSATVRNAGDGASAATTLRYYRSTDATITASDTEAGTDAVAALAPAGGGSESVDLTAPASPGTYYYGACVDAVADESDTTNNCSTSLPVNVQITVTEPEGHPDLVVAAPTVSDSGPAAGASFTLSATVRNAGEGAAAATTLRYYRSTDATITTSDTAAGTDEVAALAASGSSSESVDVTAPATAGTYYYGACVDPVTGESDIINNCSSSVRVMVSEDLEVAAPTVSDSVPAPGAKFTLSVSVKSAGEGSAATTTLSIYRSTDATITTSDTLVGTVVAELATSETSSQSTRLAASTSPGAYYVGEVELTAPNTSGKYYYGACVDTATGGADITDNCSPSALVVVMEPDLVVAATSVSDSSPTAGASFTLSATVRNAGEGTSAATTLRYYRSTDATITTSDTAAGTDAVAGLAASGSSRQSVILVAPATAGTYYYGACVDPVTGESDTTNNCSSSVTVPVTVPVANKPDLKIYAVVAGTNPFGGTGPGGLIQLSVGLRNDGDAAAAATTLRFYRSTDATITTADTEEGTVEIEELAASGTTSEGMDVNAPATTGTYYYGACVDAVPDESDMTNNCSPSVRVTVTEPVPDKPDLVLAAPTVSDSGPAAGATFTLSATVRNAGEGASAATTLRYYRSTDATIATSDTQVGTDAVTGLAAAGSSDQSVDLTAPDTSGTYYYGACVDTVTDESDTTNNCSSSVQVTVPDKPDLVVAAPTVSDSGPAAGASFTLSATVRNAGDGASAATTLRYYRSTDATIATSDTQVGTAAVAGLAAAGSSSQSVDLTAPDTSGTYYYGACVVAVPDESDMTNNCSSSVQVTVPDKPDLVVAAPTVSDSGPVAGASFTLSATVRNAGEGASAATTLRYYRSTDATITTSDTPVGTAAVAGLAAAGSSSQSVDLTAPDTSGTYYYGACVDTVTGESDMTNNCSSSVQVTVPDKPDLVVAAPTVSDSGPAAGASFTLSATVRNAGEGASAATTLRYYRSTDVTVTTSDTQVGTAAVAGLAAAGSSSQSVDLTAPDTSGTYYYGACVVAVPDESDTANNCSDSVPVTVTVPEPKPDLVVDSPSVDDSGPAAGAQFTLSATVRNDGEGTAAATTLRYYRSTDATITLSDTQVGTDEVGELAASGTSDESVSLTAPSTAGTYYYGACVVAVTDEFDTTNNCSSSVQVMVPSPQPDLVVAAPTVSDSGPAAGASFTLSATVENEGGGAAAATTLRYYQSTDGTITASDTEVGTDAVTGLAAAGSSDQSVDLTAPSGPATYYYGACVDAVTDESDTTNNCSTSVEVTVPEPKPDLVVGSPSVDDDEPAAGASFTLSATVKNEGGGAAAATTLRYYRSTDATIATSDTQVGTDSVAGLAASGSSSESVDLTAPDTSGTYYYGACVDTVTDESDTTNNCSASVEVTVETQQGSPDLVVASLSKRDNLPIASIVSINNQLVIILSPAFTLSVTVSNTGDGESAATTLRYYRSTDATITTSDTEESTDAIPELSAAGTSSQSVDLQGPFTPGTYYYGACADTVTDESDTTNNCSTSVHVTVPEPKSDLVVESPSVDDSGPTAGATFTLSATVRNDGVGTSAATTLRYYRSTDATITTSDTEVGTDEVAGLALSDSSSESVDLTAPDTSGTYYFGACVDSVTDESDTTNNCSTSVTVTVPEPAPDLVVESPSVSGSDPDAGATFTLSATVRNDGDEASAATTLRYYRSTGAVITTSDTEVGTDEVGELAASGTSDESVSLTARLPAGTYYYGACVDAVTGESDTTNNCSSAVQVTVTAPDKPDLVIYAIVTFTNPFGGTPPGGLIGMSAGVRNQGGAASPATTLRFYQSTDATITTSDTEVGTDAVGGLAASGTRSHGADVTASSSPGTYYYGACVDAVTDEFDTTNNCSGSIQVDVSE